MEIVAHQLDKQYRNGAQALKQVSLTLQAGTVNGLLGPNGAGKTTFLRMCATLEQPSAGWLTVMNRNVVQRREHRYIRHHLGYLPQDFQLYADLRCEEFLAYAATLKGLDARSIRQEIHRVLDIVNLLSDARKRIGVLSGGMKQRVGLAQALLGQPKVLILDEPTAGLDPQERIRLRNLLAGLADQCLIILSTHIVEDIAQICSNVVVLQRGRLAFEGAPATLAAMPRGRVWEVEPHTDLDLADTRLLGSRAGTGGIRHRIYAPSRPHPDAQPVAEPTLEDGYMCLDNMYEAPNRSVL
jgi:ABC-type multidrug transport system ATPase subunit